MAIKLSDVYARKALEACLRSVSGTPVFFATTLFVGLSTATATDNAGAGLVEVQTPGSGGYSRVAVAPGTTNWAAASGRSLANAVVFTFGAPSANWGTVTWMFITDHATNSIASSIVAAGALTTSKAVPSGSDPPQFAVGSIVWTVPST